MSLIMSRSKFKFIFKESLQMITTSFGLNRCKILFRPFTYTGENFLIVFRNCFARNEISKATLLKANKRRTRKERRLFLNT